MKDLRVANPGVDRAVASYSVERVAERCRAICESRDLRWVNEQRLKAASAKELFKRCQGYVETMEEKLALQNAAAVEMIIASYKLGKDLPRLVQKGRPPKVSKKSHEKSLLKDLGIDRNVSWRCQMLATLSLEHLNRYFQLCREEDKPIHMSRLTNDALAKSTGGSKISQEDLEVTCIVGRHNDDLMLGIERLYFTPGMRIADVTYNEGRFWKKIDTKKYTFLPSDLDKKYGVRSMDCTKLAYKSDTLDVVVFDPPYVSEPHGYNAHAKYNGDKTTPSWTYEQIMDLFRKGIAEAHRVLKPGGLLLVKCQDQIRYHRKMWQTVEVKQQAESVGFQAVDQRILALADVARFHLGKDRHFRCNHSVLWVFRK